ncbi:hypothetical protein ACWDX6_27725 [Streptomyces sp. NPDC003027]
MSNQANTDPRPRVRGDTALAVRLLDQVLERSAGRDDELHGAPVDE